MRKPAQKVPLKKKVSPMGQFGGSEDDVSQGEFETIELEKERYSPAIGAYMISFSELETTLNRDLAEAINDRGHEPGYRIIKYLEFGQKISIWRDDHRNFIMIGCPQKKQAALLKELDVLYKKLVELSEFRNKVAHADWTSLDAEGYVRVKIVEDKVSGGMSIEKIQMTPAVLIKFNRQNYSMSNKLPEFQDKIWEVAQ